MINDEHKINIANSEIKTFLTEHFHFQNQIQFSPSVAEKLRKNFLSVNFNLNDNFFDRNDLYDSWLNLPI